MERLTEGWPETVLLASPRGFCAGVNHAIEVLRRVQHLNGETPTYCYHEIIHNTHVVREFEDQGVKFVDDLSEANEGSTLVTSAHGVSPQLKQLAEQRRLRVIDAICPLVRKTHQEIMRHTQQGTTVLYIGKKGHDESEGALGHAPENIKLIEKVGDVGKIEVPNEEKVALVTQTTMSQDDTAEIRKAVLDRFPNVIEPPKSDICFATQNRQNGVKAMVNLGAAAVVVVGSPTSSNSKRLKEVAINSGAKAIFLDDISQLDISSFLGCKVVGLTSGASAPEDKVREILTLFITGGSKIVEIAVADESNISFSLPKELRDKDLVKV